MSGLTGRQVAGKRYVLGFDGDCSACGGLARRIGDRLAGKLEVRSLHDPPVQKWRKEILGEDAPLAPTLFEVREQGAVQAWTGWRLGANLGRFLGPADTWRVLQALGEAGGASGGASDLAHPVSGEPAGQGQAVSSSLTRGQFLKGVGGAAVAMSVLSTTGRLASPVLAQESTTRAGDEAVGASIIHPADFVVEREKYTFDDTYGFTLWKPKPDSTRDAHDHGETVPALRVAHARTLRPGQIEQRVRARLEEYSDLQTTRQEVRVGRRKLKGVAVGPIPGSTPSTEVYVPVEDRVYRINVYGERLDAEGRQLLLNLEFTRPSRSADSLALPDGKEGETHQRSGDAGLVERERSAKQNASSSSDEMGAESMVQAQSVEKQIRGGCYKAAGSYFFQTQHGKLANKRWGASYTGWTTIGRPNYWGDYTHGSYGYGRCNSQIYTNDKYAIDYPLGRGDVIFSPFKRGTVTFAGRNSTHKDYGIFVSIEADNGKYINLSAHLDGLASGIRRGVKVTDATIIGYAGNTGGPNIPVGEPHLHQAYYLYPRYNNDGSPYGGYGLKVVYHHYSGDAAGNGGGVYAFDGKSEGKWISN